MSEYLYRGLRSDEIEAGHLLIPKSQNPFLAHPRLPLTLPFRLGEHLEHAVREHQWDGKYPTSGVSTSPHRDIAQKYAGNSVIVKIDRSRLEVAVISQYRVADYVLPSEIAVPEDDEVILVSSNNVFPREIIVEIYDV